MKTMDELMGNLEDAGYDMRLQKRDLVKYRKAIEAEEPILAQRKCDELCAAVRMLLSLNKVNGVDAWEIMENLKEEGQAYGPSTGKTCDR